MGWHLVLLAAFLVQPDPATPALYVEIFNLHGNCRSDTRKRVDHQADQGAVPQAEKETGVDGIEQCSCFIGLQNGRLPTSLGVFRASDGVRGVRWNDLADHHPVEEHAQRGRPLLHGGPGVQPELRLDKCRHMHRFYLSKIEDVVLRAECRKLPHGFHVGSPGVHVADVRTEEIAHASSRFGPSNKD